MRKILGNILQRSLEVSEDWGYLKANRPATKSKTYSDLESKLSAHPYPGTLTETATL